MHKNTIPSVLALVLLCAASCFGESEVHQKRKFLGRKIVDFATQQMIIREIATWKEAPEVEKLLIVTISQQPNVTVYEIKYKAKNGDICEGEWVKITMSAKQSQTSHTYECTKENVKRRKLHAVLENDKPLFAANEDATGKHRIETE
uniref:Translation initiation factor IF-3 n=1 Tax=Lygus hesperus TaxID=30085 RepID=A0A0A9WJ09_LYGHE